MHIEISKHNPLLKPFDEKRKLEGYTTFTSAIIYAMKLFLKHEPVHYSKLTKPASKTTIEICSGCLLTHPDCSYTPDNSHNCLGFDNSF